MGDATESIFPWKLSLLKTRDYFWSSQSAKYIIFIFWLWSSFFAVNKMFPPLSTSAGSHRLSGLMTHYIIEASFLTWKCCVSSAFRVTLSWIRQHGSLSPFFKLKGSFLFLKISLNGMSLSMECCAFKIVVHVIPLKPLSQGPRERWVGRQKGEQEAEPHKNNCYRRDLRALVLFVSHHTGAKFLSLNPSPCR